MVGWLRLAFALALAALVTPALLLWQMFAMRCGWNEKPAPRFWHGFVLKLLGIRVHVHGDLARERPLLIAANHISWTDIMVLGSIADVHFIAKAEMAGWPLIGLLAKYQRTVFVDRERRRKSGEQASEIGTRIARGDPMVLFAEGTTGDGNRVMPFKSTLFGAAKMALSNGGGERVVIQPVAIAYTRLHGLPMGRQHRVHAAWIGDSDLVPHIGALLKEGAMDVEVHFGAPIEFTSDSRRKVVAAAAENEVRRMLSAALSDPRPARRKR
jgi:1-acyl-sn-glycerol-3-phosphate acyltransferase